MTTMNDEVIIVRAKLVEKKLLVAITRMEKYLSVELSRRV